MLIRRSPQHLILYSKSLIICVEIKNKYDIQELLYDDEAKKDMKL